MLSMHQKYKVLISAGIFNKSVRLVGILVDYNTVSILENKINV